MQMQNDMMQSIYSRLLTDVCELSGVPLGPPDVTYDWLVNDGPLLDKQLLNYLEGREDFPLFPPWLDPLAQEFRKSENPRLLGHLRNCLLFCYKVETQPTQQQLKESYDSYKSIDSELESSDAQMAKSRSGDRLYSALSRARNYISQVIAKCDFRNIRPSHGPGAVYPPCAPCDKSDFRTLYDSIVQWYPFDQFHIALPSFWDSAIVADNDRLSEQSRITCKITAVPKDSRGPRLICVHPSEAIWIQQGQRKVLERAISTHPLTRNSIHFTDQSVNGEAARSSSVDREYCTLDLSEASDRVSCGLVKFLFGWSYDILSCARANDVLFPDGSKLELKKWAPMGNALCFPVESLVFWSLVKSVTDAHFGGSQSDVLVFGDDIIVPKAVYSDAVWVLEAVGLKVNKRKSFSAGFFRESCGVDAYKGFDVTPYRLRVNNIDSIQSIVSLLDLAFRLRQGRYEWCASWIYSHVRSRLGYLPLVNNPSTVGLCEYIPVGLGRLMMLEPRLRWHNSTQQWVIPHRRVTSRSTRGHDCWYNLLDSILHSTGESERGIEYTVPYTAQLTYGWTPALP